jgi:hypothetical protein
MPYPVIRAREGRRDGNEAHDGAERLAGSRGDPRADLLHHDSAPAHEGRLAAPKPGATTERASSPRRRNPASVLLAKLLSAVWRDGYPANDHPSTGDMPAAARVGDDHVEAQPDNACQTAPASPHAKER